MAQHNLNFVKTALANCRNAQDEATLTWHTSKPADTTDVCPVEMEKGQNGEQSLVCIVRAQHLMNFTLWHVEDEARRKDVGDEVIAKCKRAIDGFNQRRNDFMEKVDACIVNMCSPHLPANANVRYNTESVGAALDRMSIISLKIYHMAEETERRDVDQKHIDNCSLKLATLREQRQDLFNSILELIDDYAAGIKRPKIYYQFKMYNDPSLNPALYAKK